MVLVDTSVWIEFLRQGNNRLGELLEQGEVATHSLVIGELHVGNIPKRRNFLYLLLAPVVAAMAPRKVETPPVTLYSTNRISTKSAVYRHRWSFSPTDPRKPLSAAPHLPHASQYIPAPKNLRDFACSLTA